MDEGSTPAPAPTRGVPVQLDRVRYLRYSMGVLKIIRREFGDEALTEGVSEDKVGKLLWYGLRGDDPSLTVEQIDDLVDMEHLQEVLQAMMKAMGSKAKVQLDGKAVELNPPAPTTPAAPIVAVENVADVP